MKFCWKGLHETQRNWFGQRGNSNLGIVLIRKPDPTKEEIHLDFMDLFSPSHEDTTQDWFFAASGFQAAVTKFKKKYPELEDLYVISDNGASFYATGFVLFLANSIKVTSVRVSEYAFCEPGEGKAIVDQHFKRFDEQVNQYVAAGNSINVKQLAEALKDIKGHRFYQIILERDVEPENPTPISNFHKISHITFCHNNTECLGATFYEQSFCLFSSGSGSKRNIEELNKMWENALPLLDTKVSLLDPLQRDSNSPSLQEKELKPSFIKTQKITKTRVIKKKKK